MCVSDNWRERERERERVMKVEIIARGDAAASVTSEELEKLLESALEEGGGEGKNKEGGQEGGEEDVVAEALRVVFPSSMHVVVGADVTAAVRIGAKSRTLLKVTTERSARDALTVLMYKSVSASALPPVGDDEETVECSVTAAADTRRQGVAGNAQQHGGDDGHEEELEQKQNEQEEDEEEEDEDGYVYCKSMSTRGEEEQEEQTQKQQERGRRRRKDDDEGVEHEQGRRGENTTDAAAASDDENVGTISTKAQEEDAGEESLLVEKEGSYGDDHVVRGVLLAVDRALRRRVGDSKDAKLAEKDAQDVALVIRTSLAKAYGHLWHVLTCPADFTVKTAMAPVPTTVVKCRAGQRTWIVFRHSADTNAVSIDYATLGKSLKKNIRLAAMVGGGIALFYFQTYCDGSLTGPAPKSETAVCGGLRMLLPWLLAVLAFVVVVPRLQSAARRRARKKREKVKRA